MRAQGVLNPISWSGFRRQPFAAITIKVEGQRGSSGIEGRRSGAGFRFAVCRVRSAREFRLNDFRGKEHVVVTFHPLDWTPTCESQLPILDSLESRFKAAGGQLLDISVDSIESHLAWQRKEIGMMRFPLCSDFYPHGEVTRQFGILRDEPPVPGISERAAFIVDKGGVIQFAKVYPIDQLPDIEGLLLELRKITGSV
jgi:alkyl hydroperoxide reductase subunit AhpC